MTSLPSSYSLSISLTSFATLSALNLATLSAFSMTSFVGIVTGFGCLFK
jgi:hypothetical protein